MAECSLDLIFLIRDRPFVFLVGGGGQGLIFPNSFNKIFFTDKVKVFFVIQLSTIAISPYILV